MPASPVTVVTGYFTIPSKHSPGEYREWSRNFLSIPCNLVIFTDAINSDFIRRQRAAHPNTLVVQIGFADFQTNAYLDYWRYCRSIDREHCHSTALFMVWAEKTFFCQRAKALNPFGSDYYFWTDIGCVRGKTYEPFLPTFPSAARVSKLPRDKFILHAVQPFCAGDFDFLPSVPHIPGILANTPDGWSCKSVDRIQGSFFGGHISTWERWIGLYRDELDLFASTRTYGGKDQNILCSIAIKDRLSGAGFLHLLPPSRMRGDPWFGFLAEFSDFRPKGVVYNARLGARVRLGNQLFQLAATVGIAAERSQRPAILGSWNYAPYFHLGDPLLLNPPPREIGESANCKELGFSFHPFQYRGGESLNLDGFFQSARYFGSQSDTIRALFRPSPALAEPIAHCQEQLRKDLPATARVCSFHVRRGDFGPHDPRHPRLSLDYYWRCIGIMNADRVVVFSDDPAWCRQTFQGDSFVHAADLPGRPAGAPPEIVDLFLLASCSNHIISNSTFSWWGAYLSGADTRDPGRTVLCPTERDFGGGNLDPSDLLFPHWIRVPARPEEGAPHEGAPWEPRESLEIQPQE